MDITETTAPRSDQLNYDDVASSPITATVEKVTAGTAEQPVEVHLAEFPGRPWKPAKSMRRVLIAAWGSEASEYVGRRVKLYGDPEVKFGGVKLGGIRIAALSGIDHSLSIQLTVTRGKRAPFKVDPLPDAPATQQADQEPRIAEDTWTAITEHAQAQGIEQVGQWAVEQLGRPLNRPGDITAAEGDRLLRLLTTGETEEG